LIDLNWYFYKLVNAYANSLELLEIRKFKENQDDLIKAATLQEIVVVMGHPRKDIRKKAYKILQIVYPKRFLQVKLVNFKNQLDNTELKLVNEYTVHFLVSKEPLLYVHAEKMVIENSIEFEPILIECLVSEIDALSINCSKILNKIDSSRYTSESYYDLLTNLEEEKKNTLLEILNKRLEKKELPWYIRENSIRMLGALSYPTATETLKQFLNDSDYNVRWTLAISLGNSHTKTAIDSLYHLLTDKSNEIRLVAAESLGKLFPGLNKHRNPHEILHKIGKNSPLDLLRIMKTESFDGSILRLWNKLGFKGNIIKEYLNLDDPSIIDRIIYNNDNFESDSPATKSQFLIISSKMPRILNYLDKILDKPLDGAKRKKILNLIRQIQDHFKIEQKNGLFLLL
jgi:HEAT repeats